MKPSTRFQKDGRVLDIPNWMAITLSALCVFFVLPSLQLPAQPFPDAPQVVPEQPAMEPAPPPQEPAPQPGMEPIPPPQEMAPPPPQEPTPQEESDAPPPQPRERTAAGETAPRLKFQNAPLDMVLDEYSEKTGRTLLQAPNVPKVNITLRSQGELTLEEYLQAIETVLGMHDVALLKVGEKFLKVVTMTQARQEEMQINETTEDMQLKETGALISQMIPLKHIDVAEAKKAIEPLKHGYAQIHVFEQINSILVTDTAANISRFMQIIKYIDQPAEVREEPNIIVIRYAKASDIQRKLEEIIADAQKQAQESTAPRQRTAGPPGVEKSGATAGVIRAQPPKPKETEGMAELLEEAERGIIRGKVKMVADDRTNILIIITRPENMKFFDKIVKVLDVETEPDVVVKIIRLEYADADSVASTLNTLIGKAEKPGAAVAPPTGKGEAEGASAALREYVERLQKETGAEKEKSKVGELSSANIKILPDKRTNSLLLMARKADLVTLEEIIQRMDMMLSQVLIEVVIFKIGLSKKYERGVDWVQRAMVAYQEKEGGERSPIMAFAGVGGSSEFRGSMQDPLSKGKLGDLTGASGNLSYYFTFSKLNVDAIITMIASDSKAQIMSSPTILTTDNKQASINVTKEKYFFKGLKFVSTSGSGAGEWVDDVESRKVGTKLTVTPHINEKKFVVMEITQSLEQIGEEQLVGKTRWPTISSSDLTASVAVMSGETIVLGGLVGSDESESKNKVPVLGDLPLLGALFNSLRTGQSREEVVVFITPYVLDTPEDIHAHAARRRDSMIAPGVWPGGSGSKLAEPKKKDAAAGKDDMSSESAGEQQSDKPAAETAEEPAGSGERTSGKTEPMSESNASDVESQGRRWEKTLEEIDERIEKEVAH